MFCVNMCKFTKELWFLTHVRISYQLKILRQDKILTSPRLVLLCIKWRKFITELWPLNHVRIVFLLLMTRMNRWNLTKSVINVGILTCYKTARFCQYYLSYLGGFFSHTMALGGGNCVTLTHF